MEVLVVNCLLLLPLLWWVDGARGQTACDAIAPSSVNQCYALPDCMLCKYPDGQVACRTEQDCFVGQSDANREACENISGNQMCDEIAVDCSWDFTARRCQHTPNRDTCSMRYNPYHVPEDIGACFQDSSCTVCGLGGSVPPAAECLSNHRCQPKERACHLMGSQMDCNDYTGGECKWCEDVSVCLPAERPCTSSLLDVFVPPDQIGCSSLSDVSLAGQGVGPSTSCLLYRLENPFSDCVYCEAGCRRSADCEGQFDTYYPGPIKPFPCSSVFDQELCGSSVVPECQVLENGRCAHKLVGDPRSDDWACANNFNLDSFNCLSSSLAAGVNCDWCSGTAGCRASGQCPQPGGYDPSACSTLGQNDCMLQQMLGKCQYCEQIGQCQDFYSQSPCGVHTPPTCTCGRDPSGRCAMCLTNCDCGRSYEDLSQCVSPCDGPKPGPCEGPDCLNSNPSPTPVTGGGLPLPVGNASDLPTVLKFDPSSDPLCICGLNAQGACTADCGCSHNSSAGGVTALLVSNPAFSLPELTQVLAWEARVPVPVRLDTKQTMPTCDDSKYCFDPGFAGGADAQRTGLEAGAVIEGESDTCAASSTSAVQDYALYWISDAQSPICRTAAFVQLHQSSDRLLNALSPPFPQFAPIFFFPADLPVFKGASGSVFEAPAAAEAGSSFDARTGIGQYVAVAGPSNPCSMLGSDCRSCTQLGASGTAWNVDGTRIKCGWCADTGTCVVSQLTASAFDPLETWSVDHLFAAHSLPGAPQPSLQEQQMRDLFKTAVTALGSHFQGDAFPVQDFRGTCSNLAETSDNCPANYEPVANRPFIDWLQPLDVCFSWIPDWPASDTAEIIARDLFNQPADMRLTFSGRVGHPADASVPLVADTASLPAGTAVEVVNATKYALASMCLPRRATNPGDVPLSQVQFYAPPLRHRAFCRPVNCAHNWADGRLLEPNAAYWADGCRELDFSVSAVFSCEGRLGPPVSDGEPTPSCPTFHDLLLGGGRAGEGSSLSAPDPQWSTEEPPCWTNCSLGFPDPLCAEASAVRLAKGVKTLFASPAELAATTSDPFSVCEVYTGTMIDMNGGAQQHSGTNPPEAVIRVCDAADGTLRQRSTCHEGYSCVKADLKNDVCFLLDDESWPQMEQISVTNGDFEVEVPPSWRTVSVLFPADVRHVENAFVAPRHCLLPECVQQYSSNENIWEHCVLGSAVTQCKEFAEAPFPKNVPLPYSGAYDELKSLSVESLEELLAILPVSSPEQLANAQTATVWFSSASAPHVIKLPLSESYTLAVAERSQAIDGRVMKIVLPVIAALIVVSLVVVLFVCLVRRRRRQAAERRALAPPVVASSPRPATSTSLGSPRGRLSSQNSARKSKSSKKMPATTETATVSAALAMAPSGIDSRHLIAGDELERGAKIRVDRFGVVYRGQWRDVTVAIKEMRAGSIRSRQHLIDEARGLIKVRPHENVVTFYGVVEAPLFALVTEFCVHGPLAGLLYGESASTVSLDREQVAKIVLGVAKGLKFLHAEGIIHRDVAANNVLIKDDFSPVIGELGMARSEGEAAEPGRAPIKWMAPEQLTSYQFSKATDVYAFGVLLYEVYARQPPWKPLSNVRAAQAVLAGRTLPVPAGIQPRAPARVMRLCWKRDPQQRPSMAYIVTKLTKGYAGQPAATAAPATAEPTVPAATAAADGHDDDDDDDDEGTYQMPPKSLMMKEKELQMSAGAGNEELYVDPPAGVRKSTSKRKRKKSTAAAAAAAALATSSGGGDVEDSGDQGEPDDLEDEIAEAMFGG